MKHLFEESTHQEIIERLNKISASSQRQWGTMSVSQMLAHSSIPFEYALGERVGKQSFIGKIFKPFIANSFYDDKNYKPGLPTAPEFKLTEEKDFSNEKNKLQNLINKFHTEGKAISGNSIHLFLGKISAEQWARTMYKHLDHHFRQFGV